MKIQSSIFKKFCAIVTASCFTVTIVSGNLSAAINANPSQSRQQFFDLKNSKQIDFLVSNKYGKVVSFNNNLSDTVVINIQDLHCDYFVQKNISSIIEEISSKYEIENIFVEGAIGDVDTSFLSNINSQYKHNILDMLLKEGKITGVEYYSAISNKSDLLKGVEQKDIYLKNINRLAKIINSKKEVSAYLSKISREIDFLRSKHLKSKNKQLNELLKQEESKILSQEQFLNKLLAYAKDNNISLKNYKNLEIYLGLFNNFIDNKRAQKELIVLLNEIKKTLSYDEYNQFIKLTSNLKDILKLQSFIENFCSIKNINLQKSYPNINNFFLFNEQSLKYNPIELVKEERKLIDVLRTYLSESQAELEISYLCDFEQFYKGYLTASLTATQWEYVKLGLDKFKELYARYSISNDIIHLEKYSDELNSFYDVNTERNEIFVSKMNLDKQMSKTADDKINIEQVLPSSKKIVILVAGGYHTDGINETLNKNNITNITITPSVTDSVQESRINYEYLAQQQAMSVKQMIALGLLSNANGKEQILTIISSLLANQNLDGTNINILVEQLNQIFDSNIIVSLQDNNKLEFLFTDGKKEIINIDEDIAEIVREQNKTDLSSTPLVQVTEDKLKDIVNLVSKTTFNYGKEIFAPQIYKISKEVCLFMVENKWYLGNGAIWDIANSQYDGQTLDGVEPVIYEYMPEFMQKALLDKQQNTDKRSKLILKPFIKKVISFILIFSMMLSLTACNIHNEYENYRISPQISYTMSVEETKLTEEILEELEKFYAEEGKYNSFLFDSMSYQSREILTSQDINRISNQQNLYDQALVALMFIQQAQIAKENNDYSKMNSMLSKAEEIFYAIDSNDVLYKSNLEHFIVTGEILWVGIAATQYKLVTNGSDKFDSLIAKVDKHINMFYRNVGFIYGRANESWVSTEHMLDAIGYYNLKLYCDNKYGSSSVDFNVQNRLRALSSYLYKEMYDKDKFAFYRGRNDNYYVLDTCSWGTQVILMVEYLNPELFKYGINGEFFLKSMDTNALLDYAEKHFRKTINYDGKTYSNLYSAADEEDAPIMFEWTIQMAVSYSIAANKSEIDGNIERAAKYREKAENIMKDVQDYSKALGFDYPPYIDKNGEKIYSRDGWIAYQVESIAPLAQIQQFYYGSFYFPLDDTEKQIQIIPPSSILPSTIKKLNTLISSGYFSFKNALIEILNNETLKSFFNPISFIDSHEKTAGAKTLVAVTFISFFLGLGFLLLNSIPVFLALLQSVLSAMFINIGAHVVIDFRYLKSIGLEEAIVLYGKENVKLTSDGTHISDRDSFKQIYVINDKPKSVKDFNFKSVPIKVKAENGKVIKCWIGNYKGTTILFADGAKYETIVKEFGKTRQFETIFADRTALKANVDVIEIDMNNPNSALRYSEAGNIIVGANILKTGDFIDLQKEISLLNNKKIEAVTINQNIALYIDDVVETISSSQDFMDVINLYIKNENLGVDAKILFSNKYIDRVLELLEQELGNKDLAQQKFIEMIKQLKDENKEIIVIFDEVSKNINLEQYQQYGIFSYIANNEYFDAITATKIQTKFVTNLNQISFFDGSLSIIKVSAFKNELEKASGIFTFLTSSLNLKEYMKERSIKFIKQVASNFDYNQIPNIDIDVVANMLNSETKFEELSQYLSKTDSISMYYLGLSSDEERNIFINAILERILVANYIRKFDGSYTCFGLKDKKMETILSAALVVKYNKDRNFDISSQISMDESLATAQFELEFEKMVMEKVSTGFKNDLMEINNPQSIDDLIKLIPLYSDRNVELKTANVQVMDIQNIKGILSAA